MKSVFIFGAGASKQAGAPLMGNFLDRARDLLRSNFPGVRESKSDFENVFSAISELQRVYSKSYLDLTNLETVFGAIEMGLLLGRFGKRTKDDIKKLYDSMVTLIYKTLELSIVVSPGSKGIPLAHPYDRFIDQLKDAIKKEPASDPHRFSFITFNYDICLDYMLTHHGKKFSYCLTNENSSENVIPLLKLHGSINWGKTKNDEIFPVYIKSFEHRDADLSDTSNSRVYYPIGSRIKSHTNQKGEPLIGPPVIIPPTWNKNSYHGQLSNVWARAALELSDAENIFVIGYSLPETDSFFRYLYALGSISNKTIRNFILIDPDESGEVEKRFRQMIGRGIESRFKTHKGSFESGIREINNTLVKP